MKRGSFPKPLSALVGLGGAFLASVLLAACASSDFEAAPPPAWQDPVGQDGQVWTDSADGGVELAYDTFGSIEEGEPAILLLHGWCENRGFWKPTVSALLNSSFCVTLDLPGYGGSTDGGAPANPTAWAHSIAEFCKEKHAGPWVLVGHSLGGVVALETAKLLQESDQANGVVVVHGLYDPTRKFDKAMNQAFAASMEKDFPGQMKAFVDAVVPSRSSGALTGWVTGQMQATNSAVAIKGLSALENYDLPATLKALTIPVRAINAGMRTTNTTANRRLIQDFDVFILESIKGPGLDLMLLDPTGFRALLDRALYEIEAARKE